MGPQPPLARSNNRRLANWPACLVAAVAVLSEGGCNIRSVHGDPTTGPTIGGTSPPPGTTGTRVARMCQVYVSNETSGYLDVYYIDRSSDGATRRGDLGRMQRDESRSTTVRCGDTVTAFGRGGGRNVSGSVVAQRLDDNWIRLVETAPFARARPHDSPASRVIYVCTGARPAAVCNPYPGVGVQRIARLPAVYYSTS